VTFNIFTIEDRSRELAEIVDVCHVDLQPNNKEHIPLILVLRQVLSSP